MGQVDPDHTELPDPALEHQVGQVAGQEGGDSPDTVTQHHTVRSDRMASVFYIQDLEIAAQVLDVLVRVFRILLQDRVNVG